MFRINGCQCLDPRLNENVASHAYIKQKLVTGARARRGEELTKMFPYSKYSCM